jgi:hypothetical protein
MTVRPTEQKIANITNNCQDIVSKKHVTLTEFSKLIGKLVVAEPGVEYAPLFYKPLEQEKEKNLKLHYGKYNAFIKLTDSVRTHINWWIDNLPHSKKNVLIGTPDLTLYSDASLTGYGAYVEVSKFFHKWGLVN